MNTVILQQPRRLVFGFGCAARSHEEFAQAGWRRLFVITSPQVVPAATALGAPSRPSVLMKRHAHELTPNSRFLITSKPSTIQSGSTAPWAIHPLWNPKTSSINIKPTHSPNAPSTFSKKDHGVSVSGYPALGSQQDDGCFFELGRLSVLPPCSSTRMTRISLLRL